jgi:hypothetical protein
MTRVVSVGRSKGFVLASALGTIVFASILAGCPGTLDPSQFPLSGGAGMSGAAGTTGMAGSTGTGGSTGVTGCDIAPALAKYKCSMAGCHDAGGASANFSMTGAWEANLVNVNPKGGGTLESTCAGMGPYIMKGSATGDGLFMKKIRPKPPCGLPMPFGGEPMAAADITCFQQWATALAAK